MNKNALIADFRFSGKSNPNICTVSNAVPAQKEVSMHRISLWPRSERVEYEEIG